MTNKCYFVMSRRRTCRSGEWRAVRIWRRWVMHLSWITSRGQHLLVCQELQDQSAGSSNLTGKVCFRSIQEKKRKISFSLSTWETQLFHPFAFLYNSTALKPKTHQRTDSESLCSDNILSYYSYYFCSTQHIYCAQYVYFLFVQKPRRQ